MGTATVGGFIYRGSALPELYGRMVFGDFSTALEKPSGQVFVATRQRPGMRSGRWSA